ncbi:hypothetical protein [Vibrio vulnificus]|uniref:hypothetical protein n=1 Tax=Vibrio vulnificus TaxID=672 RepID=UPI001EEC4ED8|nr:hypothetical protein [Vibrio vulnificus]MCG6299906.1 hypothetical protein [Vibrio vulnificus]
MNKQQRQEQSDDDLAERFGNAMEDSPQRNEMAGEVVRRELIIKREELFWVKSTAITAIVSLAVMGVCAIVTVWLEYQSYLQST